MFDRNSEDILGIFYREIAKLGKDLKTYRLRGLANSDLILDDEIDTNAPPKFEDFTDYLYNINNTYTRISACKVIPIAIYKPIKF